MFTYLIMRLCAFSTKIVERSIENGQFSSYCCVALHSFRMRVILITNYYHYHYCSIYIYDDNNNYINAIFIVMLFLGLCALRIHVDCV